MTRPTNLEAPIGYRPVRQPDGSTRQEPYSTIDRVAEAIRAGGFLHDAAARVGVPVDTLREWRKIGSRERRAVLAGEKRRSQLTRHQRQCVTLAERMDEAEANARLNLLGVAQRMATGQLDAEVVVTEVQKQTPTGQTVTERTIRTTPATPDGHVLTWFLARRWPNDFSGRMEITGPEGKAIDVNVTGVDRLRNHIDAIRANRDRTDPTRRTNGHETGTNGTNGHTPVTT